MEKTGVASSQATATAHGQPSAMMRSRTGSGRRHCASIHR